MTLDEIWRNKGFYVPNPKWSKGKNNTEPKYNFTLTDPETSGVGKSLSNMILDSESYDYESNKKYYKNGLTPSRVDYNLDGELAANQSSINKIGNAIAQSLVSEVALGTFKGFSDLFDFVGSKILGVTSDDYQNPVSNYLESLQEQFNNEVAPIYQNPGVDISNGGLADAGWWASNMPSVMSSLTLLIPSRLISSGAGKLFSAIGNASKGTKIVAYSSKAVNAANKYYRGTKFGHFMSTGKMRAFTKAGMQYAPEALLSRTMENYQEARGVYNDMYKESLDVLNNMSEEEYQKVLETNPETFKDVKDKNNKEEVAKAISKASADRDFYENYTNTIFDIIQLAALRNTFGKARIENSASSYSIRKWQRIHKLFPDKSFDEAEALYKQLPKSARLKNAFVDFATGQATIIGAEASEGLEEAINYMSQQEGMTVGRYLLEAKKKPGVLSIFDNRFERYLQDPQLWESAFWGVMGGVVFQHLGSGFNRVSNAIKDSGKEVVIDEVTQEKKPVTFWSALVDPVELRRRKADIANRHNKLLTLKGNLDLVAQKKNPYKKDKNGDYETFENEIDQRAAEDALKEEYILEIGMNALHNGNMDLTKEYFADENVFKALQEMFKDNSQEDARAWQQRILNSLNSLEEEYSRELTHISNLIADMPEDRQVPIEFAQMAAAENIRHRRTLETLKRQKADYETEFAREVENANRGDKLEEYKTLLRYEGLYVSLVDLMSEKESLEKQLKENKDDLGLRISLDNVNKKIDNVKSQLMSSATTANAAYSLWITKAIFDKLFALNGKVRTKNLTRMDEAITNALNNRNFDLFGNLIGFDFSSILSGQNKEMSIDEILNTYNKLDDMYRQEITDKNQGLYSIGTEVAKLERYAMSLDRHIYDEQNSIITEIDDFDRFVTQQHNIFNDLRQLAIGTSYNAITELANKYGSDVIRKALIANYEGRTISDITANFEESDAKNLQQALDIFNFRNPANNMLYDLVGEILKGVDKANDDASATTDVVEVLEEGEEDGQNNGSESPQPLQQGNPSPQPLDANRGQNLQQIEPNSIGKPVSLSIKNGKLSITPKDKRKRNTRDANVVKNEVTGELELRTSAEDFKDKNLFEQEEGVSIIDDNYVVSAWPIVKRERNGNYRIIEKGKLSVKSDEVNDVSDETYEAPLASELIEINPEDEDTPEPASEDSPDSSTGDVALTDATPTPSPAPINNDERLDNVKLSMMTEIAFQDEVNVDDDTIDLEKASENALAKLKEKVPDVSEDTLRKYVERQAKEIKEVHDILHSGNDPLSTTGAIFSYEARLEEGRGNRFGGVFEKAMDAFLAEYLKTVATPKVNGMQVINIRDILQLCNSTDGILNVKAATDMFRALKAYLATPIAKAKYIVEDIDDVLENKVIEKINQPEYKHDKEIGLNTMSQRVNINMIATMLDNPNVFDDKLTEQYRNAFDSLQEGDTLKMEIANGELIFKKGDVVIGNMPMPKVVGDSYVVYNEGWKTDVKLGANGEVISKLKDLFARFFTSDDVDSVAIRGIILQASVNKTIDGKLVKAFGQIPTIARLIALAKQSAKSENKTQETIFADWTDGSVDTERLLNHLVKLYKYTKLSKNEGDRELNNKAILKNLEKWFRKLYDSYDNISNVDTSREVKISYVSQGSLNKVFDNDEVTEYDKLPLSTEAIAPGTDARIAIVDPRDQGTMYISGKPFERVTGWSQSSTVVAIFSKNTRPDYAKAYGVTVADRNSSQLKYIWSALGYQCTDIINEIINNPSDENIAKLKDWLLSTFRTRQRHNSIPLLGAVRNGISFNVNDITTKVTGNRTHPMKGVSLDVEIDGVKYHYQFFNQSAYGVKSFGYCFSKEIIEKDTVTGEERRRFSNVVKFNNSEHPIHAFKVANELFGPLKDILQFNMSYKGIQYDAKNAPGHNSDHQGHIKWKDGKMVIDIPTSREGVHYHWEGESYNDFVLDNDLIRVNTRPSENGTNFTRRGSNQRGNQILMVDLPSVSSPVGNIQSTTQTTEQSAPTTFIDEDSVREDYNKTKSILTSSAQNKGRQVLRAIMGEEFMKEFDDLAREEDITENLLPNDIKFDEDLNAENDSKGPIASTNPYNQRSLRVRYRKAKGEHKMGDLAPGQVVVGTHFLNMASSRDAERRNRAVRKLLHEKLHYLLHNAKIDNEQLFKDIQGVYNEYKENLDNDIKLLKEAADKGDEKAKKALEDMLAMKEQLRGYSGNKLLEEFLVETLTNANYFNYLNSIKAKDGVGNANNESLFSKIARFIAKLFGWNINDDSLYMKELNILRNLDNYNNNTTFEEKKETNNEETEDNDSTEEDEDENFDYAGFNSFNSNFLNNYGETKAFTDLTEGMPAAMEEGTISSFESFKSRLDDIAQDNFDSDVNSGNIKLTCK